MSASGHIEIDDSAWPVLLIRYPDDSAPGQYAEMLARRSRYFDRRERHVIVHDMSRSRVSNSHDNRRLQMEWLKREEARIREWSLGTAFIINSTPLRLILSVMLHLRPLPMPHLVVPQLQEARPWVETQLRQAGLPVPSLELLR